MATAPDLVADVLDALFDLVDGHASLAPYGERLKVYDGPPTIDRSSEIEVWIGATGLDSDDEGARHRETWATMGAGSASQRDVEVDVPGCVWVIGGEVDMRTRRRTAAAVLGVLDTILTPPDPLSLGQLLCGGVELSAGSCRQIQSTDGASVAWSFTIHTSARI